MKSAVAWCAVFSIGCATTSLDPNPQGDGGAGIDGGVTQSDGAVDDDGGTPLDCAGGGSGWTQLGAVIDGDGTPGTDLGFASLAVGNSDRPVVAWAEGSPAIIYSARWDGASWQQLATPFDLSTGSPGYAPEVAIDGDGVALAFIEEDDATGVISLFAHRWDGAAWSAIGGGPFNDNYVNVVGHTLAVSPSGELHLAWSEYSDGFIGRSRVHVATVDATSASELTPELGGTTGPGASAITPFLAFDDTGSVVVAYSESNVHTYRRAGGAWTALGTGVITATGGSTTHTPRLSADGAGDPIAMVAEYDSVEGASKGYAFEWSGAAWTQLGGALDELSGSQAHVSPRAIAADDMGRPVIAFTERVGVPSVLYIKRWNGSAWQSLGANPVSAVGQGGTVVSARLAADGCGRLNLAMVEEDSAGNRHLAVLRYYE